MFATRTSFIDSSFMDFYPRITPNQEKVKMMIYFNVMKVKMKIFDKIRLFLSIKFLKN